MNESLRMGKRTLSIAVAAATILWSVGFSAFVAPLTARAASPGDLVKGTTLNTVYYYGADGKRYAFPNEKTYLTWYSDFSGVLTLSDSDLAAIPLGGNVVYRPGAFWVKIQSDPKVYAVSSSGSLRWIETEAVAEGLAGSDWNKFVNDVADVFFVDYTVGASLTSASSAYSGAVVSSGGSNYLVSGSTKRLVSSAGFTANRYQSRFLLDGTGVNVAGLTAGSDVTAVEAALVNTAQTATAVTPTTGALTVSLASDSPVAMTVPSQASGVVVLKFNLTAASAGTVSSITIKQGGVGATSTMSNIYLYEGSTRLTDGRSLNSSSREAVLSGLNLAFTAGQTRTFSAVVDMADNSSGGDTISLEIASASQITSGFSVGGTFPVRSSTMTTSATDVGEVTITKSGTVTNPVLGTKQSTISEFKIEANSVEGTSIQRLRLDVRDASKHSNFNLFTTDDKLVGAGVRTASDKVDFVLATPFVIGQGNNKIFRVKADVGGENADTIKVAIDQDSDLLAVGAKYGFGMVVDRGDAAGDGGTYNNSGSACTSASTSCSFSTIQGGKLTVAYNGPVVQKFKVDQKGIVLMNFTMTAQNELQIRNMQFDLSGTDFDGTAATDANFQNFRIINKTTGATVAGPEEFDGTFSDEADSVTFGDDWSMRTGESLDLQLLVDAMGSTAPYDVGGAETVTAVMDVSEIQARDTNNDDLSISGGTIIPSADLTGNAHIASAASLTVAVAASPSSYSIVKGAQNADVVGFSFLSGTSSSSRVTAASFYAIGDADATYSDEADVDIDSTINSCSLYDGLTGALIDGPDSFTTTGTSGSYSSIIAFTGFNWTIPAGQTYKMLMRCNFANTDQVTSTDDDYVFFLEQASDLDAFDDAGNDITGSMTISDANGNDPDGSESVIVSLRNSGTLAFSVAGDTPDATIILSNSTAVSVSKFKIAATYESFQIKKLTVNSDNHATLPGVASVALEYKNQVGETKTATGVLNGREVTFDGLDVYVPKDGSTNVTVKLTTGDVTNDNAASGDEVDFELHMDELADDQFEATGLSSGTTLDDDYVDASVSGGTATVTGLTVGDTTDDNDADIYLNTSKLHYMRKTKPTISLASGSPSGAAVPGLSEVLRFNVSADSRGYVTLQEITFKMTSSDNASVNWNQCDQTADGAGRDQADFTFYNYADLATALEAADTEWEFIESDGSACDEDTDDMMYVIIDLATQQEIGAGSTKTYSLYFDSGTGAGTGGVSASSANDDTVRFEIVDESVVGTWAGGTGTDGSILWADDSLTTETEIDGTAIKNLPVQGGSIIF